MFIWILHDIFDENQEVRKLPHFKFLTQVIFFLKPSFFSSYLLSILSRIYLTVTIWREEVHLKILCKWMKIPFMTLCQCFYSSREVQQKRKEEEGGGGNDKFFIFLKTENGCSKTSLTRKLHLKLKEEKKIFIWHISQTNKRFALDATCVSADLTKFVHW